MKLGAENHFQLVNEEENDFNGPDPIGIEWSQSPDKVAK